MAIARTDVYPKHLDRDIDKIHNDEYARTPTFYTMVARFENFPKGDHLRDAEVSGLGDMREIPQGGAPDFDIPVEGHDKTIYPRKFGLAFAITEEMVEDAIHPHVYKAPRTLAQSALHKQELEFWKLFNLGDTAAASGGEESWDSLPIFDSGHVTMKSGDTINNIASNALSETTFQAAFEYFDTLVNEAGRPRTATLQRLLVPTKLRWQAERLARQKGGITTESADNPPMDGNIMTVNPAHGIVNSWKVDVIRYLDAGLGGDDESWFAVSDQHDMRFVWKRKPRLESGDDFLTGNAMWKLTLRFEVSAFDYKGVYGAFVS